MMNLNTFLTFVILLLFSLSLNGQSKKNMHSYSIVGNGIINPGFSYKIGSEANADTPLLSLAAPRSQSYYPSIEFTLYWDPLSHLGFQNNYNLEYDILLFKNIYIDYGMGVGFQTNFTTDNYVVDENFEVSKRALNAHIYGTASLFVGFRVKNKIIDRSTFFRTSMFFLTPYHGRVLPSLFISAGKTF